MRRLAKCERFYRSAPEKSKSGVVIRRPVDQTPASKAFRDEFGFMKNDIMLLKEASNTSDRSLFEALASRLQVLDEKETGFNVKEAFAHWKPALIQTASEEQAWVAYTKSFMPDVYSMLYGEENQDEKQVKTSVESVDDLKTE